MATNYYAHSNFTSGDARGGLHIGQSAGGFRFLFRSWPGDSLTTYQAWHDFLRQPGITILAEPGYNIAPDEMDRIMTAARGYRDRLLEPRVRSFDIPNGYHLDGPHAFCVRDFC